MYNTDKLKEVINNNEKWPLLIEGISADHFKNATIIPADIAQKELAIEPSRSGYEFPAWLNILIAKSKKIKNHNLLIIDGLDAIEQTEQEKFYGLLKYAGLNGYSFPSGTQIVLTIKNGNIDKVSKKLLALVITYKAE